MTQQSDQAQGTQSQPLGWAVARVQAVSCELSPTCSQNCVLTARLRVSIETQRLSGKGNGGRAWTG
jgi:hypothetical protein